MAVKQTQNAAKSANGTTDAATKQTRSEQMNDSITMLQELLQQQGTTAGQSLSNTCGKNSTVLFLQ